LQTHSRLSTSHATDSSHNRSLKQHPGTRDGHARRCAGRVLQKHCTKPVCHRKACRRVVQQCMVMSEFLGYARVSTAEQTAALQQDALRAAGCSRIWSDTASGTRTDRPQLAAVFDYLRAGDTLVVWRLDRLGRSLPHLIETIGDLEARGVGFKSVQENIDTTTPGGRLVFHVFGALASFERELIQERTLAGVLRIASPKSWEPLACDRAASTKPRLRRSSPVTASER